MDTTGRTVLNKTNIPGNSSIPYTKDEISSILKFGAEELFKEKDSNSLTTAAPHSSSDQNQDEREELQLYDIDEILKRAETREDNNHTSASEELLSQFKIANFSTVEEEPIIPPDTSLLTVNGSKMAKEGVEGVKDWKDIIPESERIKVEIEEESERLKQLNMPLGVRRNRALEIKKEQEELLKLKKQKKDKVKNTNNNKNEQSSTDDENYEHDENEADESENDESDDERKHGKKRSKKSNSSEHFIKGLNVQEVRRFVRSYRKFPCPLIRIDTVAQDAQLEEKSQAFLIDFAKRMEELSKAALHEFEMSNSSSQTKLNEDSNENDLNGE